MPTVEMVKLRSQNFPDRFLGASENEGRLVQDGPLTQWKLVPGLCSERDTISFESLDKPGHYLRHKNFLLYLETNDGTQLFRKDACFHQRDNHFFDGFAAFESVNFPNFYIRHSGFRLRISKNVATDALLKVDSSFKIETIKEVFVPNVENIKLRSNNFPTHFLGVSQGVGRIIQDGPFTQWKLVPGLCGEQDTISFESVDKPAHYLRHKGFILYLETNDGSELFRKDACFHQRDNQFFNGFAAFESVNFPNFYIRHSGFRLRISQNVASDALLKVDSSFKIETV